MINLKIFEDFDEFFNWSKKFFTLCREAACIDRIDEQSCYAIVQVEGIFIAVQIEDEGIAITGDRSVQLLHQFHSFEE